MIDVYGLNNCDTCRKARKWLAAEAIEHEFHDIRKADLDEKVIAGWAGKAGWETLLNRRGTTWRGLPEADKESVDETSAVRLMTAHPALIKRPVFVVGSDVLVGFTADVQTALAR
ncbi:Spx/MgsR family RNA polymerase-binding regulatory protein [Anderseniella sp. Alg231-50]|uniref:Spx/MgsR family RNA polymerase-binding regulatory protein n=1 Tax=Anderseniella sp. Alg231-50 TaxID=1922226 RepID=UPI000D558683